MFSQQSMQCQNQLYNVFRKQSSSMMKQLFSILLRKLLIWMKKFFPRFYSGFLQWWQLTCHWAFLLMNSKNYFLSPKCSATELSFHGERWKKLRIKAKKKTETEKNQSAFSASGVKQQTLHYKSSTHTTRLCQPAANEATPYNVKNIIQ